MDKKIIKRLFSLGVLLFLVMNINAQLNLNSVCQKMLADPETGLVATSLNDFSYTYSERNTKVLSNVLKRLSKGEDILLPEGVFDLESVLVAKTLSNSTIAGAGIEKTILRRKGFSWDNNLQGDCPLRTEVFIMDNLTGFKLSDMTIDGNSHHIAISGYGRWNANTGAVMSGLPQFPTYANSDGYSSSAGGVVKVSLSKDIMFDNVKFANGFRWCIMMGKIDGFTMRNCMIDTGNLSTEFRGHFDVAPNNTVMHMHTSQDGIHLVNVSNAVIEYNDIHSEDSAIAIELNPLWNWGGFDITENVTINNNYVTTASPTDPAKLLNDEDVIYGKGLANEWIGQSAVDIFYNENFDIPGKEYMGGEDGTFRNITISQNAFEDVRQGVRCGFFIGAGANGAEHHHHRIYNVTVKEHNPRYMAGRDKDKPAGIRNVRKNEIRTSWNLTGGAGIAVRHTDSLLIADNEIKDVVGGLGITLQNVRDFSILANKIDHIKGKVLGDSNHTWEGGEGIRIWNNPNLKDDPFLDNGCFDAGNFVVKDNIIGTVETNKIAVFSTKNGTVCLKENYDTNGTSLDEVSNGYHEENCLNIDYESNPNSLSNILKNDKSNYRVYPNPTYESISIFSPEMMDGTWYKLSDMQGNLIYSDYLNQKVEEISLKELVSNVYIMQIANKTIGSEIFKIIKK